jgi:hypothetical protein
LNDCKHGLYPTACAICEDKRRLLDAAVRRRQSSLPPRKLPVCPGTPDRPRLDEVLHSAASRLSQPFSRPALVVAAWTLEPKRCGLKGFEDVHPDSGKINAYVFGKAGLIARGLLERTEGGLLMLPVEGGEPCSRPNARTARLARWNWSPPWPPRSG